MIRTFDRIGLFLVLMVLASRASAVVFQFDNKKELDQWEIFALHPLSDIRWRVEDGVLKGSGSGQDILIIKGMSFTNGEISFRLRWVEGGNLPEVGAGYRIQQPSKGGGKPGIYVFLSSGDASLTWFLIREWDAEPPERFRRGLGLVFRDFDWKRRPLKDWFSIRITAYGTRHRVWIEHRTPPIATMDIRTDPMDWMGYLGPERKAVEFPASPPESFVRGEIGMYMTIQGEIWIDDFEVSPARAVAPVSHAVTTWSALKRKY